MKGYVRGWPFVAGSYRLSSGFFVDFWPFTVRFWRLLNRFWQPEINFQGATFRSPCFRSTTGRLFVWFSCWVRGWTWAAITWVFRRCQSETPTATVTYRKSATITGRGDADTACSNTLVSTITSILQPPPLKVRWVLRSYPVPPPQRKRLLFIDKRNASVRFVWY